MKNEMQPFFDPSGFRRRGTAVAPRTFENYPDLERVLEEIGPLPPEALFLGMANDGLPVLLNMHDAVPGPLLVVGDEGSGKTNLLKGIAKGIPLIHDPESTQYAVITNNMEEWNNVPDSDNMAAIFDIHDTASNDLILSLASWAHANRNSRHSIIFIIDDLTNVGLMDNETRQNFRWLLLRGPSRKVWTIASSQTNVVDTLPDILDTFQTRIYGNITSTRLQEKLKAGGANLQNLNRGTEFKLREGTGWLKFWVPS